jgi:hypothetical protein
LTADSPAREASALSANEVLKWVPCQLRNLPAPARNRQRHPSLPRLRPVS